jgi:hypothetical protein
MLALPHSFLVLPPPKSKTFQTIMRKVHLTAIRFLLTAPISNITKRNRVRLHNFRGILTQLLKQNPDTIIKVVAQQDVLTAIRMLQVGIGNPDQLLAQAITTMCLYLKKLPEDFLWDRPFSILIDNYNERIIRFTEPALGFSIGPMGVSIKTSNQQDFSLVDINNTNDNTIWTIEYPFHTICSNIHLSTFDSNPLYLNEAHPNKTGNQTDLGKHTVEEWLLSLKQAVEIIKLFLPEWWSELPLVMNRLVPVGFYQERHLSASYTEALGLTYLSLHPEPIIMAEAIIHESQHSKLNALTWLDPILYNGHSEWTSSPVRPDIRPLIGVLLAAHAFVPVSAMYVRIQKEGHSLSNSKTFTRRYNEILSTNAKALKTLQEKSKTSPMGQKILDGLMTLDQAIRQFV